MGNLNDSNDLSYGYMARAEEYKRRRSYSKSRFEYPNSKEDKNNKEDRVFTTGDEITRKKLLQETININYPKIPLVKDANTGTNAYDLKELSEHIPLNLTDEEKTSFISLKKASKEVNNDIFKVFTGDIKIYDIFKEKSDINDKNDRKNRSVKEDNTNDTHNNTSEELDIYPHNDTEFAKTQNINWYKKTSNIDNILKLYEVTDQISFFEYFLESEYPTVITMISELIDDKITNKDYITLIQENALQMLEIDPILSEICLHNYINEKSAVNA